MKSRLEIIASNFGRDAGWELEFEGRTIAILSDCCWEDMFWDSYRVDPIDPSDLPILQSNEFWDRCDRLAFRNRRFGETARNAFPSGSAGDRFRETGRIGVRGAYLNVPTYWWDGILIRLRRLRYKS